MIAVTIDKCAHHLPHVEALSRILFGSADVATRICSALVCPPNMAFACDGLRRFSDAIRQHPDTFIAASRGVGWAGIPPDKLPDFCSRLADAIGEDPGPIGPLALARMTREHDPDSHPLRSYAYTGAPLWCGLFFTHEETTSASKYDENYSEFVCHAAAHMARRVPSPSAPSYRNYVAIWSKNGRSSEALPCFPGGGRLHSRLARAALAWRRLTRSQWQRPFGAISSADNGETLADRVHLALQITPTRKHPWRSGERRESACGDSFKESEYELIEAIGYFLELSVPGFRIPGRTGPADLDEDGDEVRRKRRRPGTRDTLDGYVRIGPWWDDDEVFDLGDVADDVTLSTSVLAAETDDETESDDLDPLEQLAGAEALCSVDAPGASDLPMPARLVDAQRNATQTGRRHQMLPWQWNMPTQAELDALAAWIRRNPHAVRGLDETGRRIHLAGHAMFALGIPFHAAARLVLTTAEHPAADNVEYLIDLRRWRIRPRIPIQKTGATKAQRDAARPMASHILLPDATNFGAALGSASIPAGRLFQRRTKQITARAEEMLPRGLNDQRLRPSALRSPLQVALYKVSNGDLATVAMLCDVRTVHSQTLLHYSTYGVMLLRRMYAKAMRLLGFPIRRAAQPPAVQRHEEEFYGARHCPRVGAISELRGALCETLTRSGRDRLLPAINATYHNAYAAYTACLLTLGLAMRARTNPTADTWDPETGIGTITDKARTAFHHRNLFLPPTVQRQMLFYAAHLRVMAEFAAHTADTNSEPFLLYLLIDGKPKPFQPRDLQGIAPSYPLPINSLRRYTRTRLIEKRVSPELIDSFMGHWHVGISPFGHFSAFDPAALRELASGPLEQIIRETGFRAIRSRATPKRRSRRPIDRRRQNLWPR